MHSHYLSICQQYNHWLDSLGYSPSVCYDYTMRTKDFLQYLHKANTSHILQLTQDHIYHYYHYLQSRPNKRRSGGIGTSHLNHNFIAIDKLLEFLHQMGMDSAPLPTGFRITPDKQAAINNIQPFTQAEIKQLIDYIPHSYPHFDFKRRELKRQQLQLIFTLYYGCGLRRSEGHRLELKDINLDRKTVFVRQGKNYKDRIIPMNESVYQSLQHYIYQFRSRYKLKHQRLFIHSTSTLNNSLQELQKAHPDTKLHNKRLSLHILRHSMATHLLQNGMAIENIARFLGHSTLDSTQIYTHIAAR